ncbi:MAG: EF-hand domain-containing protein [Novosphingobium sp.]
MRKLTIALSAAALCAGGIAYAGPGMKDHGDTTRAQAQEHGAEMFAQMDANGDGVINDADREARKGARFDALDSDGNGVLSREEFAAGQGMRGHGKGKDDMGRGKHDQMRGHGGKMMERADANGDGSVSKAEFDAAHMAMFDKADANGDGMVTDKERRAAFKQMRARVGDRTGNDNAQ